MCIHVYYFHLNVIYYYKFYASITIFDLTQGVTFRFSFGTPESVPAQSTLDYVG